MLHAENIEKLGRSEDKTSLGMILIHTFKRLGCLQMRLVDSNRQWPGNYNKIGMRTTDLPLKRH